MRETTATNGAIVYSMESDEMRKFFNAAAEKGGYEEGRWFSSSVAEAGYRMTYDFVMCRVLPRMRDARDCLEVGPGTGTWTRLVLKSVPETHVTLVDISDRMLKEARRNLSVYDDRVTCHVSDFLLFDPRRTFDFFFSSRAIEYIENKRLFIAHTASMLRPEGVGVIITKNPRYWMGSMKRQSPPSLHQGQVAAGVLRRYIENEHMDVLGVCHVTVTVPLFRSALLNQLLYAILKYVPFTQLTGVFTESYGVIFKKHGY